MGVPKMTLRVELVGEKQVKIRLLHVTDIFVNRPHKIRTRNQWTYTSGEFFNLDLIRAKVVLPTKLDLNISEVVLDFSSDGTRKILLRDFNKSLSEWSSDHFFKINRIFSDTPCIRFHKKLWIIY